MLSSGQAVALHPSSTLCGKRPPCIIFDELLRTTRDYARQVCSSSGSTPPPLWGFFHSFLPTLLLLICSSARPLLL